MNTNRIVHPGFWFGRSDIGEAVELAKAGVGGFCVYFGSKKEVKELTTLLQDNAPRKLIISSDYEYGLGRWVKDAPLLPSNISIGASGNETLAYKKGLITARQAKVLGVDWILAPNVDLADTPQNPIANTRSFGKDPCKVAKLAKAFALGLSEGGCLNSLKHFPGHGSTFVDSHLQLPVVNKTIQELEEHELIPYQELLTRADSIMVAHLKIPAFDDTWPCSFSRKVMHDYLRKHLHYKGIIVTDALIMKATGGLDPLDAFKAGADILLCPDNPFELMARLKETVKESKLLTERAATALSEQEMMLAKLNSLTPLPFKDPFMPETLSEETAKTSIVACGQAPKLKRGQSVYYIEVESFCNCSLPPKTETFIAEMEKNHINLKPYKEGVFADTLIISTTADYAAFSGQINFTKEQKDILQKAISAAKRTILISFGSPFVAQDLQNVDLFLMAGTASAPFQQEAARILLGQSEANGQMQV
ncbi:MAG: hypothetical protein LBM71_03115 [Elusimicrobiota bacterium]|jgi:beta-glucosidase-like glycosyl hydrolase|nr:hypothetical protein [Elusimicrobiota bacterium]